MNLLSDSMEPGERALYGQLALEILDLLVLWDRLLDNIAWFAGEWRIDHEEPLGDTSSDAPGELRRDTDRRDEFLRLANQAGISGDRQNFKAVFNRVRSTRHHIAHAMAMNAMTEANRAQIGIPFYAGNKRVDSLDAGRSVITLSLVKKRIRDAGWLIDHVEWARASEGQFGGPLSYPEPLTTEPASKPSNAR